MDYLKDPGPMFWSLLSVHQIILFFLNTKLNYLCPSSSLLGRWNYVIRFWPIECGLKTLSFHPGLLFTFFLLPLSYWGLGRWRWSCGHDIFLESLGTTYGRIKYHKQDFKLQRAQYIHLLCYAISYLFWQYVKFIVPELKWNKAKLQI